MLTVPLSIIEEIPRICSGNRYVPRGKSYSGVESGTRLPSLNRKMKEKEKFHPLRTAGVIPIVKTVLSCQQCILNTQYQGKRVLGISLDRAS